MIVRGDELVSSGQNRVTRDLDPTAHAEVVAIRSACSVLGDFSLAGCTLFTSCEPCPLCLSASLWARLDRVVYAADRDDAARGGFDDRAFYDLFEQPALGVADGGRRPPAPRRVRAVRRLALQGRPGQVLAGPDD